MINNFKEVILYDDNNQIPFTPDQSQSLPNLIENRAYLANNTHNTETKARQHINTRNIKITTILLNKDPAKSFIRMAQKENYIAVHTHRGKNVKTHINKKFSIVFSQIDKNKKTIKTLSHPVRNVVFAEDLNKVLFISIRKKQKDKVKMINIANYNIDDDQKSKNLNINLKDNILNDIAYSNNKCLALIAKNNTAIIMECDITNDQTEKNYTWHESSKFCCSDVINTLKFHEQGNLVFALLQNNRLAIYKKNTLQQKYLECQIISNINNMPLALNNKENLLCYDNKKLFIINCNDNLEAKDNRVDTIAEFNNIQIKAASFIRDDDIIISTHDTITKLNEVFIYKKTDNQWKAQDLDITKNVIDMKKNLFSSEIYMFYNK